MTAQPIRNMTCPVCRQPMTPTNRRGEPRKVCSRTCASIVGRPKVRGVYAEEVEDMRAYGTSPASILAALDVTAANLTRALYREGRPDLAHQFGRLAWAERKARANRARVAARAAA